MTNVTAAMLLAELPPYKDQWQQITPEQSVHDIIHEILDAHKEFAPDYDLIAPYFDGSTTEEICSNIYDFLKSNIRYKEESDKNQTTALPAGLLTRGHGDCKHYSSMAGGILDALNRAGKKINWNYRFASYQLDRKIPYHVFTVVTDRDGSEIWIDPTPGADQMQPVWQIDKKVKGSSMALNRNIAGFDAAALLIDKISANNASAGNQQTNYIGIASLTITPFDGNTINFDGTNKYAGVFNPFLGLSEYRSYGGDRNINEGQVAAQINQRIAAGPNPGHAFPADFIKWIYNQDVRSWNFLYPMGVRPGFSAAELLPPTWPRLIITDDGRLTFDRDVQVDDYRNAEIHLLTAWAQAIINEYEPVPYPITPHHLKEFSQGKQGNVETRNLFKEARGSSFIKEVGKAIEHTVNDIKDGIMTVAGFVPRNAFLALVGINAFNFAGNLWDNVQSGNSDKIKKTWETLGGRWDKLYNTIEDGAKKKALLGGLDSFRYNRIGDPATGTAATLAAAAPIIAAMLAFLDKDGKAREVLGAAKAALQVKYPDLDLDAFGFLDKQTGQYIQYQGDPQYNENLGAYNNYSQTSFSNGPLDYLKKNPAIAAGAAAALTYFLTNKKGKKKNLTAPLLAGGAVFLALSRMGGASMPMLPASNNPGVV